MRSTTLLRNLIPALIVALVLGSSFVISAGAAQNPNRDRCGYGYGDRDRCCNRSDNDESDSQGNINQQAVDKNKGGENECNEDERDRDDGGRGALESVGFTIAAAEASAVRIRKFSTSL